MSQISKNRGLSLLLVDDDAELRGGIAEFFARQGNDVSLCDDCRKALELIEEKAFDVVVLDPVLPGCSGLDALRELHARHVDCEVVVLSGEATIESADESMKFGVQEFLMKPIRLKELDRLVHRAYETGKLRKENQQLKDAIRRQHHPPQIIGRSPQMKELLRLIKRVGPTDKPVLIQGESGTGKELIARAIHEASALADKPLVTVNCAALPETLLESELFGHEKGANTGAARTKEGLFEVADGSTLFIDEIGELALGLQAKLLQVLDDGSLRRVGSFKDRRVDVRLLAATNRDLSEEVREKRFREDLFYRINVLTIQLPPLRERLSDLDELVEHIARPSWHVDSDVIPVLKRYSWPGNIRQLQNAIERAKIRADDNRIRVQNLPPDVVNNLPSHSQRSAAIGFDLFTYTRQHVLGSYHRHRGNKSETARALGISRRTLYRLLERYGASDTIRTQRIHSVIAPI